MDGFENGSKDFLIFALEKDQSQQKILLYCGVTAQTWSGHWAPKDLATGSYLLVWADPEGPLTLILEFQAS